MESVTTVVVKTNHKQPQINLTHRILTAHFTTHKGQLHQHYVDQKSRWSFIHV